jgi:hypothetical protein
MTLFKPVRWTFSAAALWFWRRRLRLNADQHQWLPVLNLDPGKRPSGGSSMHKSSGDLLCNIGMKNIFCHMKYGYLLTL